MEYSIIPFSQVRKSSESLRLDAEYFQVEKLLEKIRRLKTVKLSRGSIWITQGPNPKFSTEGIPCLTGRNIADGTLNFNDSDMVNQKEFEKLSRFKLRKNDLIITLKGAGSTGKIAIYYSDQKAIFSRNLGLIRLNDMLSPFAAFVYLTSSVGQSIIDRGVTGGTGQLTLSTSYLKDLAIPKFNDSFCRILSELMILHFNGLGVSQTLYQQAEQILLAELGLVNWKPKHRLSFIKNFSNTQTSERIDAEYFQPKYEEIKNLFEKNTKVEILENITKLIGHPSNPPYGAEDLNNKTFVVTQKHLGNYFPSDNFWEDPEALYTTDIFIKNNKQYILQSNDIILYSVGAYIGKANIYNSNIKATIGSFLTLIRPDQEKINPYYLLVFLNSEVGKQMTRRCSRGMAQQYVYPYDIRKFIIPIISKLRQDEIEKTMLESLNAKALSKHLLDIAKRGVEMAIEKDEAIAEKWIRAEIKKLGVEITV
ncbi:MAG: EcoKI restriction-modification system protein HsdS [Smithella sp. PtaU1.Bin162]|nr:MAG: EcoKI restriction-modification system protein HsdS [Smithella sp. PtaU1.Bin162]